MDGKGEDGMVVVGKVVLLFFLFLPVVLPLARSSLAVLFYVVLVVAVGYHGELCASASNPLRHPLFGVWHSTGLFWHSTRFLL